MGRDDPLDVGGQIGKADADHSRANPMAHPPRSVKYWHLDTLDHIQLKVYTDATRPAPDSLPAGTVIYNSDDGGLNVTNGTNWRGPNGGWANT